MKAKIKNRIQTYSESKNSFFYKFIKKITINARLKFFNHFKDLTKYDDSKSLLDIGTTPSIDSEQNIILEKTNKNKNITCLSNQDCNILKKKYPNVKNFVIGNAVKTDFKDGSFDIVHSNATLEHVGSLENQILFIREALRITKNYVFIQTPNRFYPIDFHTNLPIIHWFPKKIHRAALKEGIKSLVYENTSQALSYLANNTKKNETKKIIITGSIGLVGNFLSKNK